ncbi:PAS domain-containing protein [Neobacillus cucumis]|uniref:PAS domain-containing protein n=1 Tax=Neobacillus cucumis TaxID=1740721 RepID=UPI002E1BCEC1|nr:PAS domain-containing protein [Neobacillus cucumis]
MAIGNDSTPIIDWLLHLNWLPSTVVSADKGLTAEVDWRRPVLFKDEREYMGILTSGKEIAKPKKENHKISAYFKTLAETISDSVTAVDEAGNVVYWNTTAEETYKIKKKFILGKRIGEHFNDESVILHRILSEGRACKRGVSSSK